MSKIVLAKWENEGDRIVDDEEPTLRPTVNYEVKISQESANKLCEAAKEFRNDYYNKIEGFGWAGDRLTFKVRNNPVLFCFIAYSERIDCVYVDDVLYVAVVGEKTEALKQLFVKFFSYALPECNLIFEVLTQAQKQEVTNLREHEREKQSEQIRLKIAEDKLRQKQQKRLSKLSPVDLKILELRKQGVSYWGISKQLDVSMMQVRYKLQVMSGIPELNKDWSQNLQPLSREEYIQFKATA